jgi:hypothetical protein
MSRVWFCTTCGYEVNRGGRCHNCRQPLTQSDLDQLAEGEVDEEVGYRLDDWEDEARGQLIEALEDRRIRHRFEGDELVVNAEDEPVVDEVVADISSGASEAGEGAGSPDADEASVAVLEEVYDAARRLRDDPTDMIADGDLAESSAQIFAVDQIYGVDGDTWSAIGRVTRRLLGALGAEEALEEEIGKQASILCRLLEPIVAPQDTASLPWRVQRGGLGLAGGTRYQPPEAVEGRAADAADEGDDEEEEEREELVYELDEWLPEERAQLGLLLDRERITHGWEGSDLVIAEADESRVEPLFDEVDRYGAAALDDEADDTDDEQDYQLLSDLFGAADRLTGDPDDKDKQEELVEALAVVADWTTPIGLSDHQWWQVKTRANDVVHAIELAANEDVIRDGAATLRDLLRGFL